MGSSALSVLVIDDDKDVLEAAQICLRSTGWKVSTALGGDEGLRMVSADRPDVIVCDATMPKMSGSDLIELLKREFATARIPVILMTGFPVPETFGDVRWKKFLAKPFGPAELRAVIESAMAGTVA